QVFAVRGWWVGWREEGRGHWAGQRRQPGRRGRDGLPGGAHQRPDDLTGGVHPSQGVPDWRIVPAAE
ncbi:MAG: hypothetical protein ACKO3P_02625, partial [Planctomycetaceae bacterium]